MTTEENTVTEEEVVEEKAPELTEEEIQKKMEADRYEAQYKSELKLYSTMLMQGIKANTSRSQNGKKDVDYTKECVRQAMLIVNYVNQLPLNFHETN